MFILDVLSQYNLDIFLELFALALKYFREFIICIFFHISIIINKFNYTQKHISLVFHSFMYLYTQINFLLTSSLIQLV